MESWLRKEMATMIGERVADAYILPHQGRYRLASFERGQVKERRSLTLAGGQQLIAYFKYRANMAVTEHRRPQSGGISWPSKEGVVNLRLSTVGDFTGQESLVIRFIYPVSTDYQLLVPTQWQNLHRFARQRGLVLFAGPLGSGKTTTMYRLAREVKKEQVVMTIGGYNGTDNAISLKKFKQLVKDGKVKYFYISSHTNNNAIVKWVKKYGTKVSASAYGGTSSQTKGVGAMGSTNATLYRLSASK